MKEQILQLRNSGKTYNEISLILGCSKGTISYHCGEGQKQKIKDRKIRLKSGIYIPKKETKKNPYNILFNHLSGSERMRAVCNHKILESKFEDLISFERKRKRVILEQSGKCNGCGLSNWQNLPIILEIDHIDGNNKNNVRENLEGLCPNCHSITDTWRGRNRRDKLNLIKLTPEDFVNAFKNNNGNVRKALLSLDLAGKGANYKTMYKYLDSYDIEYIRQSKRKASIA